MKTLLWDFDETLATRGSGFGQYVFSVTTQLLPREENRTPIAHALKQFPWHHPEKTHTEITSADEWWARYGQELIDAYRSLGVPTPKCLSILKTIRAGYSDPEHWRLYDDALPALTTLSAAGWHHIVLSNHVPELDQLVVSLGLNSAIQAVLNSARTGYEKPRPEAFALAQRVAGDPSDIVMVGDSYEADVLGARSVGMRAIHLLRHRAPEHEAVRHEPAYLVHTLADVAVLLGAS
jgi:putative hydrolase of the HAD superfamily